MAWSSHRFPELQLEVLYLRAFFICIQINIYLPFSQKRNSSKFRMLSQVVHFGFRERSLAIYEFWLKVYLYVCIHSQKNIKNTYPYVTDDRELHTHFASIGCFPKWCYGDEERQRADKLLNKCRYFYFLCVHKIFLSLHKIQIEPLMADGLFWQCFYTFLCLDSVIYLAVNGTVTSLPVFIQNILNCVPGTNKAFTGLERHGGKWLMTKFAFRGGVSL